MVPEPESAAGGNHFSRSMSAVLVDADTADDLLRCADSAMFQNKRGRSAIRHALSA